MSLKLFWKLFCRNLFVKFNLGGLNLTGHFEENVKEQDEYDRELEAEKEATDNYADDFEEMDESEEQVVPPAPEIESPSIPSSTYTHNISSVDVKSQKTNFSGAPFQTLQQQNSAQPSAPFRTFATATTGGSRSQPSQYESSQQESKMSMMSTNSDDASRLQSFNVDPELKQNTEANKGQATKSSSKNRPPREKQDPTPEISQAIGAPSNQSIRYWSI